MACSYFSSAKGNTFFVLPCITPSLSSLLLRFQNRGCITTDGSKAACLARIGYNMTSKNQFYLAYGSNMCTPRIMARVPSATPIGIVPVEGFQLQTNKISHDGSSKCNLVVHPHSHAWCVLFSMLPAELPRLDRAEGRGFGYERETVQISYRGESIDAFWYLAPAEYCSDELLPYGWYMNFVRAGAMEHQLPQNYQEHLRNWQTTLDPNQERRHFNQMILESSPQSKPDC